MRKPLLIFGAGGLGREVYAMVSSDDRWEVKGFIDDGVTPNSKVSGLKVLGGVDVVNSFSTSVNVVFAIANPEPKASLVKKITNPLITFPVLTHPSVILLDHQRISIGKGSIIAAGCILTTDITVGEHVLLNLNCTVGHDTTIGNFTSVMPGVNISGDVTIGEGVFIGSGANVINRINIGNHGRIGMGAVVIRDVPPNITVAGVPAKPL